MKLASPVKTNKAQLSNGDVLHLPCVVNYFYITTNEQAEEAVQELLPLTVSEATMLAVDVETNGFDPYINDMLLMQLGTKDNVQYVFDVRKIEKSILIPVLIQPCWKVGHNIKFDAKFIKTKIGIDLEHLYDTQLAEHVIRGGEYFGGERYSLDAIVRRRLGRELKITSHSLSRETADSGKTERVKKRMQESFLEVKDQPFSPAQLAYAAQDVATGVLFDLVEWQRKQLMSESLNTLYNPHVASTDPAIRKDYETLFPQKLSLWKTAAMEFKFLEVVIGLELAGMGFSLETHRDVLDNIQKDYQEYRKEFLRLLSKKTSQKTLFGTAGINPDSNQQVLSALNELGLELPDTNSNNLAVKLKELEEGTIEYKLVQCLLSYRASSKLVQAFGEKLIRHVHPITGRMHPGVKQILDTGRISTSNPNCFSADTEVLTNLGWKFFKDLDGTEQVAQFEPEGEIIELVKPVEHIKYPFNGNLVHLKTRSIDLLVTPDHRCLLKDVETGEYKVALAKDYPPDHIQLHAGNFVMGYKLDTSDSRNYSLTTNHTKTLVPYNGYVYCVSVPSSYLVIRRKQCVSITGNCQQIPGQIEWKLTGDKLKDEKIKARKHLRDCFQAKEGSTLVIYDYSAQELRVAAAISLEQVMLKAFKENKDLHCYSATLMYDEDYDTFVNKLHSGDKEAKEKRSIAKTVSFGSLYGSGAPNLSRVLHVDLDKAKDIINRFWGSYPILRDSMLRYGDLAHHIGYSNTALGRRRYYTDILEKIKWVQVDDTVVSIQQRIDSENMIWFTEKEGPVTEDNIKKAKEAIIRKYKGEIARQAANHAVQGTSADITKLASIYIHNRMKELKLNARIIALVHDEIIVECQHSEASTVQQIMDDGMKKGFYHFCPIVPCVVEGGVSEYWRK